MKFSKQDKLKFGLFIGPYHKPGINPTLTFQQDLEIIEQMDRLGFDEVWVGEHHSGGVELVDDPMLFIAAAAERTKRLEFGTGAVTLPWHHPFQIASRIVQLSHQTRGRVHLGVAPGQLLQDALMMGTDVKQHRLMMEESLSCIIRLLKGEVVTHKSDWFTLENAELQLLPYNDFDVQIVSVISPNAPYAAGKNGANIISVAATDPAGFKVLDTQWALMEKTAAEFNQPAPERSKWRLMGPMHIAPTVEQAMEEIRWGMPTLETYRANIHKQAQGVDYHDVEGTVKLLNETGGAIVGTPEMARAQIQRLLDKTGGFGSYLLMGVDWADHEATLRSHRLFAQEVMPYFDGTIDQPLKSFDMVMNDGGAGADRTWEAQQLVVEQLGLNKQDTALA
ncbi:LLM class flavin-dependent oxidoreductase [Leucobacter sp. Z1108]|uniref:LLM class flavin-dependent oxidoreductase n=1 Tax=Leucobacter sp. Z1108 TaxID=3439066 RepID=UPI003F36B660